MRHNKSDAEIMAAPHWAIVENVTTHHEGDERSRTNPGHGYPAHTTSLMVYRPYETEAELLDVVRRKGSHEKFKVIKSQPVSIKTETVLTIKD